jgi:hypothetical protein
VIIYIEPPPGFDYTLTVCGNVVYFPVPTNPETPASPDTDSAQHSPDDRP